MRHEHARQGSGQVILYEYPFNERIRTYLRLEYLLLRLQELLGRSDVIDHQYALQTIFEAAEVASRTDLKTDMLKDLERQRAALQIYKDYPDIDHSVLDRIFTRIDYCAKNLTTMVGKPGQMIADSEWLNAIRSRMGIPGGVCNFDLPLFHHWKHRPSSTRLRDLENWANSLTPVADTVFLLLKLIRDTGTAHRVAVTRGQFQQNLPPPRGGSSCCACGCIRVMMSRRKSALTACWCLSASWSRAGRVSPCPPKRICRSKWLFAGCRRTLEAEIAHAWGVELRIFTCVLHGVYLCWAIVAFCFVYCYVPFRKFQCFDD